MPPYRRRHPSVRPLAWSRALRTGATAFGATLLSAGVAGVAGAQSGGDPLSSRAPAPAFADPQRATKLAGAFPAIDRLMREFAERGNVPGIAYGIIIDGKVAHIGVHGLRHVQSRAPVDTGTVFRIASMSKSFAALAVLQLRDAGKLSLDTPAERYVPQLARLRYPTTDAPRITVRDLLTHGAGFPEDNPWGDQQLAATEDDLTRMIERGIPFSTSPGTAYEYSNFGFAILGRIVANVSGMPYARYLREQVLMPLGMRSTTLQAAEVPAQRLAHGYRRQDGAWVEEPQLPDGSFGPMGGMLTSIADLGRWVSLMLDAWPPRDGAEVGPLRRSSLREMQSVNRFSGASATRNATTGALSLSAGGYGYGLRSSLSCAYAHSVSHTGGLPGFGSVMAWLPDYGVGIVALGNLTYTGWTPVTGQAMALLAETGGLQARVPSPAPVLATRQGQVTRLVTGWNDALADSLAAMNLFLDESKPRRRAAVQRLVTEAGGSCRPEGALVPLNALRGSWRLRCATGDLLVTITLAPTEPATVQHLVVAPIARDARIEPAPVCRG